MSHVHVHTYIHGVTVFEHESYEYMYVLNFDNENGRDSFAVLYK